MGTHKRRMAIWNTLCQRKQDTAGHLAAEFHVSLRTIYYDLDAAVVTSADDFKRIDERQVLEIVIDGAQRNMKFCCQMSSGILFTLA